MAVGTLEIDGLTKRFGSVIALRDTSFDVRQGEIFGFVGSNGAGKSTTMRIVLGVTEADAGQVRWRGQPVTAESRRQIGYMPEERGLYPRMKVREQLIYLAQLHGMAKGTAERSVDIWTERLGVANRAQDEVQKLSLGNQQRVQLSAALIHDPQVLVLDEPFAGLDPIAVDVMSGVLRDKADEGIPVVFSSHQLDLVERLCDRVGIIQQGRMVAVGSVDELRETEIRRYVVRVEASHGWADGLAGVTRANYDDGSAVIELSPDADEQALLQAALGLGPVREFRLDRPSLVELYRDVVQVTAEEE
jgi:ABC-2 type transport system ATP-binding protein